MAYTDDILAQQEAERKRQEQEQERQRQEIELRRQQMMASQQQSPAAGGIDPSSALTVAQSFMGGGSPAAGGIGGGAGAGAGGSGGGAGSLASAWPLAVAAVIGGHHNWARKKGMHTNEDAITGRALYKDSEYYQEKGNAKLDGAGDEIRLAAMGSSPADLFRKDTWTTAAKLAAQGGILGKMVKKIF